MTNQDILEKFLDLLERNMFSKPADLGFARVISNDFDRSPFWNLALCRENLNEKQISLVEEKFATLNRKPTFYFEQANPFAPLIEKLTKNNYRLHNEDSWMFYEGKVVVTSHFDQIKRVDNQADLKTWLETLDKCYIENDPQNPYGKLGPYIELAGRAWEKNNAPSKLEYFIAFKKSEPVAVATLTHQQGLGYISNVGSIPEVRGQGYGKLITLYCVNQAKQKKAKEIFLATEEGTYPNTFYKRIGFKTRFTARGYTKD